MAAPRHSWPLARGFDRWYGFHGGETHQFVPALYHDNHRWPPPLRRGGLPPERGPGRPGHRPAGRPAGGRPGPAVLPLLLHRGLPLAPPRSRATGSSGMRAGSTRAGTPGATRSSPASSRRAARPGDRAGPAPALGAGLGHAPARRSRRWPPGSWSASPAFLSYTDAQLGRVLDFLEQTGDRENTLVILVSDNGASSEGGPSGSINDNRTCNVDPAGPEETARADRRARWARQPQQLPVGVDDGRQHPVQALEAGGARRRGRRSLHRQLARGIVAVGGAIRRQFAHAVDVLPTVLELVGIEAPETIDYVPQTPIDGISFASDARARTAADAPGRTTTQHFEMFGSRAIYHDGWKAVTFKPIGPLYDDGINWNAPFDEDRWELYHVADDPSEIHDLADRGAGSAGRHGRAVVGRGPGATRSCRSTTGCCTRWSIPSPDCRAPRLSTTYYPGTSPVPETVAANVKNRSHSIDVDVTVPDGGARRRECCWPRARCSVGSRSTSGGTAPLRAQSLRQGAPRHRAGGPTRCPRASPGRPTASTAEEHGGGTGRLEVDGEVVAEGEIPCFTVSAFSSTNAGLTCGYEFGPAVGAGLRGTLPAARRNPHGHRHPQRARARQPGGRVRTDHGRAVAGRR